MLIHIEAWLKGLLFIKLKKNHSNLEKKLMYIQ